MNRKKVLVIASSPRKNANSTILACSIAEGAEEAGAEVEILRLYDFTIKPCRGCYACTHPENTNCVQQDDMQLLYPKIREADAIVLATPVYFFNMSGQLKVFLDRCLPVCYSMGGLRDKKLAVSISFRGVDIFESGGGNILRSFQDLCQYCDMFMCGHVYISATEEGQAAIEPEKLLQAKILGAKLV